MIMRGIDLFATEYKYLMAASALSFDQLPESQRSIHFFATTGISAICSAVSDSIMYLPQTTGERIIFARNADLVGAWLNNAEPMFRMIEHAVFSDDNESLAVEF